MGNEDTSSTRTSLEKERKYVPAKGFYSTVGLIPSVCTPSQSQNPLGVTWNHLSSFSQSPDAFQDGKTDPSRPLLCGWMAVAANAAVGVATSGSAPVVIKEEVCGWPVIPSQGQ